MSEDQTLTGYISAGRTIETRGIQRLLIELGASPLVVEDLPASAGSAVDLTLAAIDRCDFVVALPSVEENDRVWFELGLAAASRKPFIVAAFGDVPVPIDLVGKQLVREVTQDYGGLRLAAAQLIERLSAESKDRRPRGRDAPKEQSHPVGDAIDELIRRVSRDDVAQQHAELVGVIAEALRAGGAKPVVGGPDARFDLGVWDPALEGLVGNPFVIEIKTNLRDGAAVIRALDQVERYREATSGRWALLVYGRGDPSRIGDAARQRRVLVTSADALLSRLREVAFPEFVRELRAERVHGRNAG